MRSKVAGVNREASQAAFFQLMATGVPELTKLSGEHMLTMWICNNIFQVFISSTSSTQQCTEPACRPLTPEEADITHYIGGFVCSKLKQRNSDSKYNELLSAVISSAEPEQETLLAAKSRGRLTNLTRDGQCIFEQLEQIFCTIFPPTVVRVDVAEYADACLKNEIVQSCFHNATSNLDIDEKENVLLNIISLYFKVRVSQKCKVIIEKVRNKRRASKQEKALRSKLAK